MNATFWITIFWIAIAHYWSKIFAKLKKSNSFKNKYVKQLVWAQREHLKAKTIVFKRRFSSMD